MLGITSTQIWIPGMVPLYEEHLIRTKLSYTIEQWYNLDPMERAMEIAVSRIENAVEYQKNKAQEREMKKPKGR